MLSFYTDKVSSIYFSLIAGELVFLIGLLKTINNYELAKKRITNIVVFIPYLAIPVLARLTLGDTGVALIFSLLIYGLLVFATQYKKFSTGILIAK